MKHLNKSLKPALKRAGHGFTIIEVMIVLAIAGLIMVVVFLAVPALERSQRDNARQSIVDRVKAEMETYAGNNQGQYPFKSDACTDTTGEWCDFVDRYIVGTGNDASDPNSYKVNVKDPSTGNAVVTKTGVPVAYSSSLASTTIPSALKRGDFYVVYGAKCSGESITSSGTLSGGTPSLSTRNYAVIIGLDRAGTAYCVDNG